MQTIYRNIEALQKWSKIDPEKGLIPVDDLQIIITELTAGLLHSSEKLVRREAVKLAACYPTFKASPEWIGLIAKTLSKAPGDLIEKICLEISGSSTFPPSRALVRQAVDGAISKRTVILGRAKAMMKTHENLAQEKGGSNV